MSVINVGSSSLLGMSGAVSLLPVVAAFVGSFLLDGCRVSAGGYKEMSSILLTNTLLSISCELVVNLALAPS